MLVFAYVSLFPFRPCSSYKSDLILFISEQFIYNFNASSGLLNVIKIRRKGFWRNRLKCEEIELAFSDWWNPHNNRAAIRWALTWCLRWLALRYMMISVSSTKKSNPIEFHFISNFYIGNDLIFLRLILLRCRCIPSFYEDEDKEINPPTFPEMVSSIEIGKPFQLQFVRKAQMMLFANVLCDPPLGDVISVPYHQKSVCIESCCM